MAARRDLISFSDDAKLRWGKWMMGQKRNDRQHAARIHSVLRCDSDLAGYKAFNIMLVFAAGAIES